jgi:hypothetical protein
MLFDFSFEGRFWESIRKLKLELILSQCDINLLKLSCYVMHQPV